MIVKCLYYIVDHSTGGRNVPSTPTKVNSRSNVNGGTDWKYSPWKIVNENQRTKPDQNRRITTTRENKPNGRVVWSWTSGNNRRGQQTNNQNSQPRTSRNWNLPQSWNRNTGRNMNIRRRVWTSGQNTGTPITNWSYSWSS